MDYFIIIGIYENLLEANFDGKKMALGLDCSSLDDAL
jgi:hypothetical protein